MSSLALLILLVTVLTLLGIAVYLHWSDYSATKQGLEAASSV